MIQDTLKYKNHKFVVQFPLVDLGWWVTILWMVVDYPGDGG